MWTLLALLILLLGAVLGCAWVIVRGDRSGDDDWWDEQGCNVRPFRRGR